MFLTPGVTPWKTTLPGVVNGANNPGIRVFEYDQATLSLQVRSPGSTGARGGGGGEVGGDVIASLPSLTLPQLIHPLPTPEPQQGQVTSTLPELRFRTLELPPQSCHQVRSILLPQISLCPGSQPPT